MKDKCKEGRMQAKINKKKLEITKIKTKLDDFKKMM